VVHKRQISVKEAENVRNNQQGNGLFHAFQQMKQERQRRLSLGGFLSLVVPSAVFATLDKRRDFSDPGGALCIQPV